jgi:hypothetical protein
VTEPVDVPLEPLPTQRLFALYSEILTELLRRGVIRSLNAPAGDLAELLVAMAYHGTMAPPSAKSWDVETENGRRLQVKCRVMPPGRLSSGGFSPFRSWEFDACVFVILDGATYEVIRGLELTREHVERDAREVKHIAGHRLTVSQVLANTAATDVTEPLRAAFAGLPQGVP